MLWRSLAVERGSSIDAGARALSSYAPVRGPRGNTPQLPPLRKRRGAKLAAAALLLPIAVIALALALLDPVAFANRHLGPIEKIARERLGRTLTLGTIQGQMYPELAVVIHGIQLSGDAPDEEPMLSLPRLELRFDLKRALLSFGQEMTLESVRVDGGVLRIRRDPNGGIDLIDVLKKLPPLDPKDLEGGVLGELWVDGGNLVLIDESLGREIVVHEVHAETRGAVALGAPLDGFVSASVHALGTDGGVPAHFELRVAEFPKDLVFWPPPPASARLDIPAVDLAGAIAWLSLPELFTAGTVDVSIEATSTAENIRATVNVDGRALSTVVTTGAGAGVESEGVDSEAHLATTALLEVQSKRVVVESFVLTGAGLDIAGQGAFVRPTLDGIESLDLMIASEELARLGSVIPPLRNANPGALRLSGAGTAKVLASPGRVHVVLALDDARVQIGEALSKRRGETLRIEIDGARDIDGQAPARMDTLVVAQLPHGVRIDGSLIVQPSGADVALFDLHSNTVTLQRAVAVSPVLRDLIAGNARGGFVNAALLGRMGVVDSDFDLKLRTRDMTIVVDKSTLSGDAAVNLGIATGGGGLALDLNGDLRGMSIVTLDNNGKTLFEKQAEHALTVHASLLEVGGPGSLGRALEGLDDDGPSAGKLFVGNGLSPRWRAIILGLAVRGTLEAERATLAGVAFDDAVFRASMNRGRVFVERSSVRVLEGHGSLKGSVIDLQKSPPTWGLVANVQDVDLKKLLEPIRAITGAVSGDITLAARLNGAGLSIESVLSSLEGPITLTTREVRLGAIDFLSSMSSAVWSLIEKVPGVSAADVEQARGPTLAATIADRSWTMRFRGNQLKLEEPVHVDTRLGLLTLNGHAAIDGAIAFLARFDMNSIGDAPALPVEVSIGGTWDKPEVSSVNVDKVVGQAVDSVKRALNEGLFDSLRRAAAKVQEGVQEKVDQTQRDVDKALGKDVSDDGSERDR